MSIHNIQRHLSGVKLEPLLRRYLEHVQVYMRVFVTGETYVAKLPRFARLQKRRIGSRLVEDSMRVFVAQDLVMLHQVYVISCSRRSDSSSCVPAPCFVRPSILPVNGTEVGNPHCPRAALRLPRLSAESCVLVTNAAICSLGTLAEGL
jgi:hypothetical protein